ncbi:MAG TPA: choice-of-anchor D domain-containing protein [Burkholderiaceae bacterium]|nr:choice-of-anchor D domain-containing protein [Burkholderiaceae bacterium]
MSRAVLKLARHCAAVLLVAAGSGAGQAQTTGDPNAGQQLFTATLSPPCASCHSATDPAAANSLKAVRDRITARATPAGAAGTMSFAKALEALERALTGTSLSGATTGMNALFPALTSTQKGDLAAFIAQVTGAAPVLRYAPASGPIFPATAVGATASATATISNTGTADLVFATNNAATIASGGDAADFRVTSSNCPGTTLRPNSGNCTVNVTFQPAAGTSLTRTASISLATATGSSLVPLAGSVVAASTSSTAATSGSAANPPSGGGGGVVWAWPLMLFLVLAARRGACSKP